MTNDQAAHVARLLGTPHLKRLVDRLVRRIEFGMALTGPVVLSKVTVEERSAIAGLFGRLPGAGSAMTVDLDRLDEIVVRSGAAPSLVAAVSALRGPILVHADEAGRERRAWDAVYTEFDALLALRPEYAAWVRRMRESGHVRRLARNPDAASTLVARVVSVLTVLPANGESLQRLAVRTLGSAHALDRGTLESSLVLSALRGESPTQGSNTERRRLWQRVGVALDELSSTVLVHRLALPGALGMLTAEGEPLVLTLRQVMKLAVTPPARPVFVCENPSVVESAAREIPDGGAPLVCVGGQPSLAADLLLRRLAPAGLRYHGDFDWGGIRIANRVYKRVGFEPWRYRTCDYETSIDPGTPLTGRPANAVWDPTLRAALERRGLRVEEESHLDLLLADLAEG